MHPTGEDLMPLWQRSGFWCAFAMIMGGIGFQIGLFFFPDLFKGLTKGELIVLFFMVLGACGFISVGLWLLCGRIYWEYVWVIRNDGKDKANVFTGVVIPMVCFITYVLVIIFICIRLWSICRFGFIIRGTEV